MRRASPPAKNGLPLGAVGKLVFDRCPLANEQEKAVKSMAGRWMRWCGAVILGAFAAVDRTCAGTADPEPSNEVLAHLFADLATGREFERAGRTLRWERPIRYAVMSREPSEVAERAPRVLEEFAAIAGVPVEASELLPWSDPSVIPEHTLTTEDGFRGHIQRVRGKGIDDDPHFVATWGRGDDSGARRGDPDHAGRRSRDSRRPARRRGSAHGSTPARPGRGAPGLPLLPPREPQIPHRPRAGSVEHQSGPHDGKSLHQRRAVPGIRSPQRRERVVL